MIMLNKVSLCKDLPVYIELEFIRKIAIATDFFFFFFFFFTWFYFVGLELNRNNHLKFGKSTFNIEDQLYIY